MKKANGKLKSLQDIQIYPDAILWGSKVAGQQLPYTFFEEMEKYQVSYKKDISKQNMQGRSTKQQLTI